jgi:hypothetical protein
MRRRPFRVSISSTSSIVSVKGTIAEARPPVASRRGSGSSSSMRRTTPSIRPAKPKTTPDWIAARLERPIAVSGSSRSMRPMRAARSTRAVSYISRPGAIAPPR